MTEELKTYRGNCHCAAYIYEIKLPENFKANKCNCSSCYRKGAVWVMAENENIHWVKGDVDTLTNYTFGEKTFNHKFCSNCGTQLLIVGIRTAPKPGEKSEPTTVFNLRSFQHGQGVDVWTKETNPIDGKCFRKQYEPAKFTGPEPKAVVEGGKLYTGCCHCGAVRVALKIKPLDKDSKDSITECNCSICGRLGQVWIYPQKDHVEIEGKENLTTYLFNRRLWGKTFCKTCGIAIGNTGQPVTEDDLNKMSEEQRNFVKGGLTIEPINLRIFDDLNVEDLNVGRFDGYTKNPSPYVEP